MNEETLARAISDNYFNMLDNNKKFTYSESPILYVKKYLEVFEIARSEIKKRKFNNNDVNGLKPILK